MRALNPSGPTEAFKFLVVDNLASPIANQYILAGCRFLKIIL